MKVRIGAEPEPGQEPYGHLKPIVKALLAAGNTPSPSVGHQIPNELGFYQDKDGWRCDLRQPIDFDLIDAKFDLPPTLALNREANSISDRRTWVQISGKLT